MAKYRADGVIVYLGRNDDQVKLRGNRIEVGEIETLLLRHPQIKESVVLLREDQPGNKRLVAYAVTKDGQSIDIETIRQMLKVNLPEYMIPSAFVFLTEFPLNTNGKLDRKSLPAPECRSYLQKEFVSPRDEAEEAVAKIWCEVIGVDKLSVHDDFFELGGNSLNGVQITGRVKQLFGLDVPVKILFEAPTVAGFVDKLTEYQCE